MQELFFSSITHMYTYYNGDDDYIYKEISRNSGELLQVGKIVETLVKPRFGGYNSGSLQHPSSSGNGAH